MPNIQKYNQNQPAARFRLVTGFKTSALLAPFAAYGLAGAQATDAATQLTTAAKSQMEAVVPLLVGLLVVGIGITVAFFVNKNAKKGVKSAG